MAALILSFVQAGLGSLASYLAAHEQVVCSGRIPGEAEITTWLAMALEKA